MSGVRLLSTCCVAVAFAAIAVHARPQKSPDRAVTVPVAAPNMTITTPLTPTVPKPKRSTRFNAADDYYGDETPVRHKRGVALGTPAPLNATLPTTPSLPVPSPVPNPKPKRSPKADDYDVRELIRAVRMAQAPGMAAGGTAMNGTVTTMKPKAKRSVENEAKRLVRSPDDDEDDYDEPEPAKPAEPEDGEAPPPAPPAEGDDDYHDDGDE